MGSWTNHSVARAFSSGQSCNSHTGNFYTNGRTAHSYNMLIGVHTPSKILVRSAWESPSVTTSNHIGKVRSACGGLGVSFPFDVLENWGVEMRDVREVHRVPGVDPMWCLETVNERAPFLVLCEGQSLPLIPYIGHTRKNPSYSVFSVSRIPESTSQFATALWGLGEREWSFLARCRVLDHLVFLRDDVAAAKSLIRPQRYCSPATSGQYDFDAEQHMAFDGVCRGILRVEGEGSGRHFAMKPKTVFGDPDAWYEMRPPRVRPLALYPGRLRERDQLASRMLEL